MAADSMCELLHCLYSGRQKGRKGASVGTPLVPPNASPEGLSLCLSLCARVRCVSRAIILQIASYLVHLLGRTVWGVRKEGIRSPSGGF